MEQLSNLALGTVLNCQIDISNMSPFIINVLAFSRLCTFFIIIGVYGLALFQRELYFLFLGIGLNIDWILNLILTYLIRQPTPVEGCGSVYGMPCYQCQHSAFLFAIALTFFVFYQNVKLRYGALFITSLMWYFSAFGNYLLQYNSASQVVVGSLLGFYLGIIFQILIWLILYPKRNDIVNNDCNSTFCGYTTSF